MCRITSNKSESFLNHSSNLYMMRMGAVRGPGIDKKKEEVLKDLSPDVRDMVERLMEQYKGKELEERLDKIISIEKARKLVERR
jgi:hypothetical protein